MLCYVRKIINSIKLVDFLQVQADNQWYNYASSNVIMVFISIYEGHLESS